MSTSFQRQYRVRYFERSSDVPALDGWFVCSAEDAAHAIEQAKEYAAGAEIDLDSCQEI